MSQTGFQPGPTGVASASANAEALSRLQRRVRVLAGDQTDSIDESVDELTRVTRPGRMYFALKRVIDALGAAGLLVVLSPLMLGLAAAVKLTSRGPVFFRQQRCGQHGEVFTILKFRTMVADAQSLREEVVHLDITAGPTFKSPVDPRITSIGRVMRHYSLDELPQIWHVLTGQMSLVGPRPLVTEESLQLPAWAEARLCAKPGLTCIWQVSGRSLIPFEEWMALDVEYVRTRSTLSDVKLLLRTPIAVLTGRGAF
jgi:lipopolysaccharide/colanic/teichoic acid biosynthesis glycosyltransferase